MKNLFKEITILGSGTSTGIPVVGCSCRVCKSPTTENTRLRTSIIIKNSFGKSILIDTTPDLRTQLLREKITSINACIITHNHADHVHGIDDLRPLTFGSTKNEIPIWTDINCLKKLKKTFPYIFCREDQLKKNDIPLGGGIPNLSLHPVNYNGPLTISGSEFEFFLLPHGHGQTLGFYSEGLAYLIDCHHIPEHIIQYLKTKNIDLLIIDCVTDRPHKTHLSRDLAFSYIQQIAPKAAGLIHMNHDLEHVELIRASQIAFNFPVFPVFDGQKISC